MSPLWHPHPKEAPLTGLTGLWGGVGGNLVSAAPVDTYTNSLQYHYTQGTPAGLQTINFGGTERTLRYNTHNSKGWAEVCFIGNVPFGHHETTDFRTGQYMINENLHATNGGLDYTANVSKVMIGDVPTTDFLITSKNSRENNTMTSTGENQDSALPLTKSNIAGTQAAECQDAMMEFFKGNIGGFSAYDNNGYAEATINARYNADWQGPSPDGYAIQLLSRGGSTDTDHWFIASGQGNSGSTYHANIGMRATVDGGSWYAKNVGSWSSNGQPKASSYLMDNSNVFSFWLTDM